MRINWKLGDPFRRGDLKKAKEIEDRERYRKMKKRGELPNPRVGARLKRDLLDKFYRPDPSMDQSRCFYCGLFHVAYDPVPPVKIFANMGTDRPEKPLLIPCCDRCAKELQNYFNFDLAARCQFIRERLNHSKRKLLKESSTQRPKHSKD